ncbi:HNH endonuclease [Myxococcota bacterium]|nr:HNH endonuclease [Myxococcota bacterium]
MSSRKRQMILDIIRTDRTFERAEVRGHECWVGKCIHCQARLIVRLDGEPVSRATIEHIEPQTHGGTDALDNLALACARCNGQKGIHLDVRRRDDPKLAEVIERLRSRRKARWRDPPDGA